MKAREVCRYFESTICRSCGLLDLPYAEQIRRKVMGIKALLLSHAIPEAVLAPMHECEPGFRSSHAAKLAVGGDLQRTLLGFPDSAGNVRNVEQCPLHAEGLNELASCALSLLRAEGIPPYNVAERNGELKYILLRKALGTGQCMARFVLRSRQCAAAVRAVAQRLQDMFPCLRVTSLNIHPDHRAAVEGSEEILLSREEWIEECLGGVRLSLSPRSFFQVTSAVAAELYQTACRWLCESGTENLLDLFCGVGAFSLSAAAHLKHACGVERYDGAVIDALRGAALNGYANCSYVAGDVKTFLERSADFDAVVVNPPRRGLAQDEIPLLLKMRPRLILYSSCNPLSLFRDMALLRASYDVRRIQPFDMFPHTAHVEILSHLELRE